MFFGTSSGVGKSLMAAALCRVLLRKGEKPFPFKGQNMSNNAWVDKYGGEMAYSQVIQAWASGLEPNSAMNPILLKPKGNEISEVIHLGRSVGTSKADKYYEDWFDSGWASIQEGLKQLRELFINGRFILEGAGSPVEVNLQHRDLTNLRLATLLKANCILVADIERGGVFAQIIGTLALLKPNERSLIKGIIINRFRGSISLFNSGREWIEDNTGIPVLGVMPWLNEIFPPEDSLDLLERKKTSPNKDIEIAVIKLPCISNFSDIEPLENETTVNLTWIEPGDEIGNVDVIVLPGSKQTLRDLEVLISSNLDNQIKEHVKNGGDVIGICGGMQILGKELIDPECIESTNNCYKSMGLNLLPIKTVFTEKKLLNQREILIKWPEELETKGFELHQGRSEPLDSLTSDLMPLFEDPSLGYLKRNDGLGYIIGSYLHGIFENGKWRRLWINTIREKKGLNRLPLVSTDYQEKRLNIIDSLAEEFEKNINLDLISLD